MDASPVVGVATGVAPERSFCFLNAVRELVLQMIARLRLRPRDARTAPEPGARRGGVTPIPPGWPEPANPPHLAGGLRPEEAGGFAIALRAAGWAGGLCGPIGSAESRSRLWVIGTVIIFGVTGKYKGPRDLAYRGHRWVLSPSSTAE